MDTHRMAEADEIAIVVLPCRAAKTGAGRAQAPVDDAAAVHGVRAGSVAHASCRAAAGACAAGGRACVVRAGTARARRTWRERAAVIDADEFGRPRRAFEAVSVHGRRTVFGAPAECTDVCVMSVLCIAMAPACVAAGARDAGQGRMRAEDTARMREAVWHRRWSNRVRGMSYRARHGAGARRGRGQDGAPGHRWRGGRIQEANGSGRH